MPGVGCCKLLGHAPRSSNAVLSKEDSSVKPSMSLPDDAAEEVEPACEAARWLRRRPRRFGAFIVL